VDKRKAPILYWIAVHHVSNFIFEYDVCLTAQTLDEEERRKRVELHRVTAAKIIMLLIKRPKGQANQVPGKLLKSHARLFWLTYLLVEPR
jgi:hypothetical protein